MIKDKLTYISLFSSAGVGCFGFKQEGYECIATNELLDKRLNIQKINKKCRYDSGYIGADIQKETTKQLIYQEIVKWEKLGNDRVDVVIATPPCQGMSVANHKKKEKEIERNSLIKESVDLINNINPRFFIFENVSAFWKTGCIDKKGNIVAIGDMITKELGTKYLIHHEVINFKNYGSNSSRTRTLVIGVDKRYSDDISPIEIMPNYVQEKTLYEVIGDMKSLDWGEYDSNDFFHSFRVYPINMLPWIKDLKQGQSAFDNENDELKPHKVVNGEIIINKSKNADKYTRQIYNKVAPCIHTRNDQMASQNTVHPIDNRVFSIRELMRMMTIPETFKWLDYDLTYLNELSIEEKRKISKKEELNIRQSIGEAVPTIIFRQIANKIKTSILYPRFTQKDIEKMIETNSLDNIENLKHFLLENKEKYSISTLSKIIEFANSKRLQNSAYFTNKYIIQTIFENLPNFDTNTLNIIEPSVGSGNFLPFIFKKYENVEHVNLTVIDIDKNAIDTLKIIYDKKRIPDNFTVKFICTDFMNYEFDNVDLIIGNPPFTKVASLYRNSLLQNNINQQSTNLAEFFLEKAIKKSNYVSLIMPKNILNTPEFFETREWLAKYKIDSIIDFGENGFKGVLVETINLMIDCKGKSSYTKIISTTNNKTTLQKSDYIFNEKLPYWVIYRDDFFDKIYNKMNFNVFDVFRDRQITNNNTSPVMLNNDYIRVLKSRNILDSGEIVDINGYDSFIDKKVLAGLTVQKFLEDDTVYLTPNMTYKPRLVKKEKGYIVNGSVAILIPKDHNLKITKEQLDYISSDEFRNFYKIARNYQTRSLNIDKTSCYWFGINKEK